MAHFPKHMNRAEMVTVNKLLSIVLGAGYHVKVIEGEEGETLQPYTTDRKSIQKEIAASALTVLRFAKPSEKTAGKFVPVGFVLLVHGNGEDVLGNYGAMTPAGMEKMDEMIGHL